MSIFSLDCSTFNDNRSCKLSSSMPRSIPWVHILADDSLACWKSSWKSARLLKPAGGKNACAPSVCNTSKMPQCLNDALTDMIKTACLKCKISPRWLRWKKEHKYKQRSWEKTKEETKQAGAERCQRKYEYVIVIITPYAWIQPSSIHLLGRKRFPVWSNIITVRWKRM